MYTRQEASLIRQNFWTSFGRYMKPIPGEDGEPVNWLNYKTGVKHLYFRMDADNKGASIYIEISESAERADIFSKLRQLQSLITAETGENWNWQEHFTDDSGRSSSRIGLYLPGVNIFDQSTWPAIISFFKPRIIALDRFWSQVKYNFQ